MEISRWVLPNMEEAIRWAKARNIQGIRCIIDSLGEFSTDDQAAFRAMEASISLISMMRQSEVRATISIKPTALGAGFDPKGCKERAINIAITAQDASIGIELDMESIKFVDQTISLARTLRSYHGDVTLAVQAYLDRTLMDVENVIHRDIKVRLVKGAYLGDENDFNKIRSRLLDLHRHLSARGVPHGIGSHDPIILDGVASKPEDKELIEIGMLKGLGDETKLRLISDGWSLAEYVPFGNDASAYVKRRERYLLELEKKGLEPCP